MRLITANLRIGACTCRKFRPNANRVTHTTFFDRALSLAVDWDMALAPVSSARCLTRARAKIFYFCLSVRLPAEDPVPAPARTEVRRRPPRRRPVTGGGQQLHRDEHDASKKPCEIEANSDPGLFPVPDRWFRSIPARVAFNNRAEAKPRGKQRPRARSSLEAFPFVR